MDEKMVLDKGTFKALAAESRVKILKMLADKQYTLSDFSENLNLGKSTIKEHLDILQKADLIKQLEEGRKWKYYKLTFKGRKFVNPQEVKVFFTFIVSLIALPVSLFFLISKGIGRFGAISSQSVEKVMLAEQAVMETALDNAAAKAPEIASTFPTELIFVIIFALILVYCTRYYIKKKIGGKRK